MWYGICLRFMQRNAETVYCCCHIRIYKVIDINGFIFNGYDGSQRRRACPFIYG
jgi:hypothetical protein